MVEGLNEREESRKFHQDLATGAEREEDHSKRTATEPSMRQGIGFGGMEGEVRSAVSSACFSGWRGLWVPREPAGAGVEGAVGKARAGEGSLGGKDL